MRQHMTTAVVAAAIAAVIAPGPSHAQGDYPNRVVKIVVPYGAASAPTFWCARSRLACRAGWASSSSSRTRPAAAARSAPPRWCVPNPTGYTLLFAPAVVLSVLPQARNADAGYKPTPCCRSVRPSSTPWDLSCGRTHRSGHRRPRDCREAEAGALNYGHPGLLTIPQLAVEEFQQVAGIDIKDIPVPHRAAIDHRVAWRTARCGVAGDGTEVGQNIRVIGVFSEKRIATFPMCYRKEQGYDVTPASFGGLLAPLERRHRSCPSCRRPAPRPPRTTSMRRPPSAPGIPTTITTTPQRSGTPRARDIESKARVLTRLKTQ